MKPIYFKVLTIGWSLIILFLTLAPDTTGGEKFWLLEIKGMDKVAHFGLFFILSIISYPAFNNKSLNPKRHLFISIIYGILLSFLTEFGQQFVQGRTSDLMDFLADTIGVILGTLISKMVLFNYLKSEKDKIN